MPFKSDKQRRYLWSQKPDVAKQIAHKDSGGPVSWWNKRMAGSPQFRGFIDDKDDIYEEINPTEYDKRFRKKVGDLDFDNDSAYYDTPTYYIPQQKPVQPNQRMTNEQIAELAKQYNFKFDDGGEVPMMDNRKPSKITKKDRYGNQVTVEYQPEVKPLDPTAIAKAAMEQGVDGVGIEMPEMYDHPGEPQGSDTVPAWLTPGEFVVNAEAMRMPGAREAVENINDQGRSIQQAQGGSIPTMNMGGQVPFLAGPRLNEPQYQDDGGWITDSLLDKLAEVESGGDNEAVSPVGALGKYQWMPKSAANAGYGVKAFDPKDEKAARAATKKYLKNMQKYHGFTPEETLRAYNWGPGNVINYNKGKRKDIPDEALNYPRKILGVENTEGVTPPPGMTPPMPTPRPSAQPGAMPTPRPDNLGQPEWKQFMNKYLLGKKTQFKAGGGEIRNPFPPGTYEYEQFEKSRVTSNYVPEIDYSIPQGKSTSKSQGYNPIDGLFDLLSIGAIGFDGGGNVPSNVVPALTDVPSGHAMFGGNQNLAGEVMGNDPLEENSMASLYEQEVPWYAPILGHKSKEALNIPLNEDDKARVQAEAAADSKLHGAEDEAAFIGDGNNMEEVVSKGAGIDGEGDPMKKEIDKMEVDDFKEYAKTPDGKKEISTDIANEVAAKDKDATGPGKDQPGDNATEEQVEKAGNKTDNSFKSQALGALKGAFGDLFDKKELARMAIMYAGSRALGYSHGGSLQWAAKNYINRVDTKAANKATTTKELLKSGKYTTKSIEAYSKSGKISDLQSATAPQTRTGTYKTFYGPGGTQIKAEQVKVGKSSYWMAGDKIIDGTKFNENPANVKGTKEWQSKFNDYKKETASQLKELKSTFGSFKGTDGSTKYVTDITPTTSAHKIAEWADKNGVEPNKLQGLVESAYHDAINDKRQDGSRARDLVPYLNQLIIRQKTGTPDAFVAKGYEPGDGPKQYINASKLSLLNDGAATMMKNAGKQGTSQDLANQFYTAAIKDWNALDTKQQERYMSKALDDENGFYVFINEQYAKYLK